MRFRDVVEAIAAAGPRLLADRVRRRRCPLAARPPDAGGCDGASRHPWSEDVETTARGAAMLAAAGVGAPPVDTPTAAAGDERAKSSQVHEPDPAGAAACAEGHRRYRVIFDALADRFGELA